VHRHRRSSRPASIDGGAPPPGTEDDRVPKIPDSTKNSLHWRLATRARERWPALAEVRMRYRAGFAYVDGVLADGEVLQLCRLRYLSSATVWGFAIYRASHDDYEDNVLPSGSPTGTAEEALDCACGLYLNDPTAWTSHPRCFNGEKH
jgi:hypothetical protein